MKISRLLSIIILILALGGSHAQGANDDNSNKKTLEDFFAERQRAFADIREINKQMRLLLAQQLPAQSLLENVTISPAPEKIQPLSTNKGGPSKLSGQHPTHQTHQTIETRTKSSPNHALSQVSKNTKKINLLSSRIVAAGCLGVVCALAHRAASDLLNSVALTA